MKTLLTLATALLLVGCDNYVLQDGKTANVVHEEESRGNGYHYYKVTDGSSSGYIIITKEEKFKVGDLIEIRKVERP